MVKEYINIVEVVAILKDTQLAELSHALERQMQDVEERVLQELFSQAGPTWV